MRDERRVALGVGEKTLPIMVDISLSTLLAESTARFPGVGLSTDLPCSGVRLDPADALGGGNGEPTSPQLIDVVARDSFCTVAAGAGDAAVGVFMSSSCKGTPPVPERGVEAPFPAMLKVISSSTCCSPSVNGVAGALAATGEFSIFFRDALF